MEAWKGVIGVHGEDVENDSGRRLFSFSAENELKIVKTHFHQKRMHKFTWSYPGRGLQSITDYFLVRSDQRKQVHDVRVIRGTEIDS